MPQMGDGFNNMQQSNNFNMMNGENPGMGLAGSSYLKGVGNN
jgi:hypothetical protein|tara:strand:- start:1549 stop:1674 length:126 start_codon:yes stop_codon:yes gene_type:complete